MTPKKGEPSLCHPHRPVKALGMCGSCYERDLKERKPDYAERQRASTRRWWRKDQDRALKERLRRFNITRDEYDGLVSRSAGACEICRTVPPKLFIDHCHETGLVRGLLCHFCNAGIGLFKDEPRLMAAASAYIRTHRVA